MDLLTLEEYKLLATISEDIEGVYAIPLWMLEDARPGHNWQASVPTDVRKQVEGKLSDLYRAFLQRGLIDVFRFTAHGRHELLPFGEAMEELRNLRNFDPSPEATSLIGVMTSIDGIKALEHSKPTWYGKA
jgi:hypothetical protein